ncbi:MAG: VRR-NUC domain-containing protein [Chitinophagia bacterium]
MNEKILERKLREAVKSLGGIALKFSSVFYTGMPDRIVLMEGGKLFFVELKSTGGTPSPRQRIVHQMLQKLGFEVWVIDTPELLQEFLKHIQK